MRKAVLLGVAGVLALVLVALFATGHAVMLVLLVAWHALLIVLPMAAAVFAGLRGGIRDTTILALYGLASGGLAAFVLFWVWRFFPTAGALGSVACIAASAAAIAWFLSRLEREAISAARPLGIATLVWAFYGLFILAFALAPLGFHAPLGAVQHHFGIPLPNDNGLPLHFARQITEERVTVPMIGDWLTSDRPPLQTAYFLASAASLLPRSDFHYQVQSTLLQALWVPGMWLLLRGFDLARGAIFLALVAGMFSGFALINGIYTWPKLLPVAYLAVASAILLFTPLEAADRGVAMGVGACVALAALSHPGSLLILPGLAVLLVWLRRIPRGRFLAIAALAAVVIMLPWTLYQKFVDPPGNRLMKWHIGGVTPIDDRSTFQTVRDSYANLPFEQFLDNRLENLKSIVGPADIPELVAKATTVGVSDQQAWRLRNMQFLHIGTTLGVLSLAWLAWLVPRAWRTREFRASLHLSVACMVAIVPWVLVMFHAGGTTIHTGSYAVVCFLFSAAMLAFFAANRWLAIAALGLHARLTYEVYARGAPLALNATAADYRAFDGLAVAALAIACFGLWKLCAMRETR